MLKAEVTLVGMGMTSPSTGCYRITGQFSLGDVYPRYFGYAPNWKDIRTKFGYNKLAESAGAL